MPLKKEAVFFVICLVYNNLINLTIMVEEKETVVKKNKKGVAKVNLQ